MFVFAALHEEHKNNGFPLSLPLFQNSELSTEQHFFSMKELFCCITGVQYTRASKLPALN